jgi:drug/metabolite transporter (DMT)-like permease
MSLTAFGLLIAAAAIHTGWNLLLKQAGETYIATWWALVVATICFFPLLLRGPLFSIDVWPYAIGSALVGTAYYLTLATVYGKGDFSLVYPVARGAAPALLAVWSVLFLNEQPHLMGVVGLIVVVFGLVVVGSTAWRTEQQVAPRASSVCLSLLVALFISIYSVVDAVAVQFAHPLPYTVMVFGLTTMLVTPVVFKRYGWDALRAEWGMYWPRIILIGCLMLISYNLVLAAYAHTLVSYAGAIREISIVFAALAGWQWLGEGFGVLRASGAIIIFGGIVLISIAS